MVIMTRLIAPGVKRVFVSEAEGSVPHLMNGDLGGTVCQRIGANRSTAAAIDCRVNDDEYDGELGHLRRSYLKRGAGIANEQSTDVIGAKGGIEVSSDTCTSAARAGRVVGTGVSRTDVDPKNVDCWTQLIERRRVSECGTERSTGVVEVILLGIGKAFG